MGELKNVSPGGSVRFSATEHNAFIAAARAHRDQDSGSGPAEISSRQNTIVLVRNDSGADQNRLAVLGIDGPIIHPDDNLNEFRRRVVLKGVVPEIGTHDGKFVILAEPLADGAIGRAYIDGVCPVRLSVGAVQETQVLADHDGTTGELVTYANGCATILWREGGTPPLTEWAIVRIGRPQPMRTYPLNLTHVGGSNGSASTAASWTYDCYDIVSGLKLLTAVNPVSSPHVYKRPTIGKMTTATSAIAYTDLYAQIVIQWTNEVAEVEACA